MEQILALLNWHMGQEGTTLEDLREECRRLLSENQRLRHEREELVLRIDGLVATIEDMQARITPIKKPN